MNKEIEKYNSLQSAEEQKICNILMDVINNNNTEAQCKIWHGGPVWFIDGNPVVGYCKLSNGIQLLFWSGKSFEEEYLKPVGKYMAAEIRYKEANQINNDDLIRWINKSKEIQWNYKNIVKSKGVLLRLK